MVRGVLTFAFIIKFYFRKYLAFKDINQIFIFLIKTSITAKQIIDEWEFIKGIEKIINKKNKIFRLDFKEKSSLIKKMILEK